MRTIWLQHKRIYISNTIWLPLQICIWLILRSCFINNKKFIQNQKIYTLYEHYTCEVNELKRNRKWKRRNNNQITHTNNERISIKLSIKMEIKLEYLSNEKDGKDYGRLKMYWCFRDGSWIVRKGNPKKTIKIKYNISRM